MNATPQIDDTQTGPLNEPEIADMAQAFAALGSEARLAVLRILVRCGSEGLNMSDLAARSGIGASTLTHHLRALTAAGLVEQRKAGRSIIASAVSMDRVERLASFLVEHCCADARVTNPQGDDG